MNDTKHTPGPWNVDYDNDTGPNDDYYEQWFTVGPARIYFQPHGQVQAEANARLIAAAPELLEALRYAQQVIFKYTHQREVPAGMILGVSSAMEAAIAKAEGAAVRA